jgi:trk system potassium uptake protein
MYIIIGGAGDAGRALGQILSDKGHEIAFIDKDPDALEKAGRVDSLTVEGNISDFRSLLDAGIDNCDFYIGLSKDDNTNLVSCSLANFYGCKTIARVKSTSMAREPISRRYTPIGADLVLCPSLIASSMLSRIFAFPSRLTGINKSGIETFRATVDDDSKVKNKKIEDIELPDGAKIVSIFRGVQQILPTDSEQLETEDELCIFLDDRVNKENIEEILGGELVSYRKIENVFIAGAREIGLTLAKKLLDAKIDVSIMDISEVRTKKAAEILPEASVVKADPLGHGVLIKEGIEQFDVLLAMGKNLERNTFISILSKQFNVPTAVTLIDRVDLKESVENTLVDSAVIPNLLLVNTIQNILKQQKTDYEPKRSMFTGTRFSKIKETKEILSQEIKVTKRVRCLGKSIETFSPEIGNFLIPVVVKNDKGFIPTDDYILKEKDRLFVLFHETDYETVQRWLVG